MTKQEKEKLQAMLNEFTDKLLEFKGETITRQSDVKVLKFNTFGGLTLDFTEFLDGDKK